MFEVTYGEIRNPLFKRAFSKVSNSTGFKDVRIVRNIVRIGNLLEKYEKEVQECWIKLLKQYAKLDDKGEFEPTTGPDGKPQMGTYQIREEFIGEQWEKAVNEFGELKVEVSANKMRLHELAACNLSPAELSFLEPMVKDLAEEEAEQEEASLKAVKN